MLELKQIVKDYVSGGETVHALKGVDLRFRTSEFVSILGPSGCGKTTLLNIIGGLDQYTSGDLVIDGVSTKDYKDRDWDTYRNHSIGFVFQTYNLIPHQTVLKNVELALTLAGVPKSERKPRAVEALKLVGLGDKVNKRPNQLSGGQMQRVAIARALVNNPDIILADEPTGALDTETGIQVMELLKDVAKDRLVVMVTHNPELAEQYSSRIIRILDGVLVGDTAPLSDKEYEAEKQAEIARAQAEEGEVVEQSVTADVAQQGDESENQAVASEKPKSRKKKSKKKSSMSLWTAFKLSLNNLFTKKGRTLLTSFAGSIGIIGIALILSVSQGMTDYINVVQQQTLTTYPLTIQSTAMDLSSLVGAMMSAQQTEDHSNSNSVHQRSIVQSVAKIVDATAGTQNDLESFKKFLEKEVADDNSKLSSAIAGLQYQYNLNINIFGKNPNDDIQEINPRDMLIKIMTSQFDGEGAMNSAMGGYAASMTTFSVNLFQEILPEPVHDYENGEGLINSLVFDQYELVAGEWPTAYDEVVLIMNSNNEISDIALYALGILGDDYVDDVVALINGDITEEEMNSRVDNWTYDEIRNTEITYILSSDLYMQTANGTWKDVRDDDVQLKMIYDTKGIPLTIKGIVRPNPDATAHMLNGTIGYTAALVDYVVGAAEDSAAVQAQAEDHETDILTGLPFSANKSNLSAERKIEAFLEYFESLTLDKKVDAYGEMRCIDAADEIEARAKSTLDLMTSIPNYRNMMATLMVSMPQFADYSKDSILAYLNAMSDEAIKNMALPLLIASERADYKLDCIDDLPEDEQDVLDVINDYLYSDDRTNEQIVAYYDGDIIEFSNATWEDNMAKLGWVDLDKPSAINIYASSFEAKDIIAEEIARYNESVDEAQQITYTDFVALVMSAVTTIIDAITYVLIAFVAISLIVSSIMIGVITLISVQERTKEIGILRAIGASKHDVSSMFNAETVIIGFAAGLIGVLVTYVLCIPINAILHFLTGIATLNAILPPIAAVILVLISMGLTLLSGLIPSRSAAKKDPVVALRTE